MFSFLNFRKKIFYGWWIVGISILVNAVPAGLYFVGFSVLFLPIARDLNMNRASASLPFSLTRIITGFQSPLIGIFIDRFGPSKVLFVCTLFAGLGYILLSRADSYLMYFLIILFVLSPPIIGGFDSTSINVTSQWFVRKRGVALSIIAIGFALGGSVLSPLIALSSQSFGWRDTTLGVGLLLWLVYLPLSIFLYRSPEDRGLLPDGDSPRDTGSDATGYGYKTAVSTQYGAELSPRFALTSSTYWFLAFSLAMRGMVFSAIVVHMVPIMIWKGIDESTAGLLIGMFTLPWIPVSLMMGWLGSQWPKKYVAAMGGLISGSGMFLLLLMDQVEIWQMVLVFMLWAFSEGSLPLGWTMLADEFGRKNLGVLRGTIMTLFSFLSIGTPFYAGWIFDRYESYTWLIIPAGTILILAGLLNWSMPSIRSNSTQPS